MLETLAPQPLWDNFAALNQVPRPSKQEERVIAFMQDYARSLGLQAETDSTGNVLVRKPGTRPGPTVIIQSHLDMVCQKNSDTKFDFQTQGIAMQLDGDWLRALGTTLGADNGIGVAAAMALLASKDLQHPPLEALFTIDEETGMTGAKGLRGGWLQGQVLLNLDTEEDDELTIGCAGGIDISGRKTFETQAPAAGVTGLSIKVSGLRGGHSGMDIHRGRANANKVMNRCLLALGDTVALASIDGGGLRNAIPRESKAVVAVADSDLAKVEQKLRELCPVLAAEYASTDPDLQLNWETVGAPERVLQVEDQRRLLRALQVLPSGIHRMSPDVDGLVQTSNNLARVEVNEGQFSIHCLCRGSVDSEKLDHAEGLRSALELLGAEVCFSGAYPGWAPRPDSRIVQLMREIYVELFQEQPKVTACHAGLECGILGTNYPTVEMISFGPNIRGAHSPDECVQISSVQKFWKLLTETLARL